MSKNDMLGPILRALVAVPQEYLGTILDATNKLKADDLASAAHYAVALKKLNRGEAIPASGISAPPFTHDKTKDGWKLLECGPARTLTDKGFEVVEFLDRGESSVKGNVMAKRATHLNANLGQHDAEYLFENQHLIPTEYRGKYYLVFPGSKWRSADGDVNVPFLRWAGARWCLRFLWLGIGFRDGGRLVRSRKSR